jgi:hypothetical protein
LLCKGDGVDIVCDCCLLMMSIYQVCGCRKNRIVCSPARSLNQSDFCTRTDEWAGIIIESDMCRSKSEFSARLCKLVSLVAKLEEDWVDVLIVEGFCGPLINGLGSGHVEFGTIRDSAK